MRVIWLAVLLSILPAPAGSGRTPVLVELFTSEGCSSCPPADLLLSQLSAEQPVAGAEILALELHVDYWDQLGWKDPASLREATARQQAYSRVFGADRVYTPQAVVDGNVEAVGSDAASLRRAVARAADQPHVPLTLDAAFDGARAIVRVSRGDVPAQIREPLETVVAIVEDDVNSAVSRGENRGRALHHDAVVRTIKKVSSDAATNGAVIPLAASWNHSRLRAVAFVQGRRSQRVWGSVAGGIR